MALVSKLKNLDSGSTIRCKAATCEQFSSDLSFVSYSTKGMIIKMEHMSRTQAREKAFEIIFMIDFCDSVEFELDRLSAELKNHKKHMKYIEDVVLSVDKNKESIDELISEKIGEGWSISRISKMSLAILRLAAAEICYMDDIPAAVSINEAVMLSKKYGEENEPSFINGVLSKLVK